MQQGQDPAFADAYVCKIAPYLTSDEYQLQQAELERDVLGQAKGKDDPAFTAISNRAAKMRAAYTAKLDAARAKAKVTILEELNQNYQAEISKLEGLNSRVNDLKQDLGELSNATVAYYNLQEEQKGLREQLRAIKQQIEALMTEQGTRQSIDIHWHLTPDAVP